MNEESLFVSDLHLSAAAPAALHRFLTFLDGRARRARTLYILGDLFDVYLGDDDHASPFREVRARLRALSDHGVDIYLQHGNRDFLIGERFCQETGATLLPEEHRLDLYGTPTLLCHGDLLCTDDILYQAARTRVRSPDWKANALGKPLWLRRLYARWYRFKSGLDKGKKSLEIMDANPKAILEALNRHQAHRLIHGHTHRPGHFLLKNGERTVDRLVLPEWNGQEWILVINAQGFHQEPLRVV